MSMPGFVFHIRCDECEFTSPDYPLFVFPDLFSADIVLPAWSSRFRCYSELRCILASEDRSLLEKNFDRLKEFASELSSPNLTVGVPRLSLAAGSSQVTVDPPPVCPRCGRPAKAHSGHSSKESVPSSPDITDPFALSIASLGLSVRAFHGLEKAGITTVGELCEQTTEKLLATPHLLEATVVEIRRKVEGVGLKLREGQ